jgi:hypothetical protein
VLRVSLVVLLLTPPFNTASLCSCLLYYTQTQFYFLSKNLSQGNQVHEARTV